MSAFYGKVYVYPTPSHGDRPLGVIEGLIRGIYLVAWSTERGGLHRVKTPLLPPGPDPARLQERLDAWAAERGLRPALPETPQ